MDETYRKYHSGRYGSTKEYGPSEEVNKKQTELQRKTEETFESGTTEEVKNLRDKTRKELEELGI